MRALLILAAIVAMVVGNEALSLLRRPPESMVAVQLPEMRMEGSLSARLISGLPAPTSGPLLIDTGVERTFLLAAPAPDPLPVVQEPPAAATPHVQLSTGHGDTASPPEPHTDGPEWVRSLVCAEHYTWPCWEAMAVIRCESNYDPNAWNDWSLTPDPYDGVGGLFQVAVPLHNGLLSGSVFDPVANTNAAHHLYVNSGYRWSHWAWVCRP